jgi:hypothetical protein
MYLYTVPLENLESDGVPEVRLEEGSHAQPDIRWAGYQSSLKVHKRDKFLGWIQFRIFRFCQKKILIGPLLRKISLFLLCSAESTLGYTETKQNQLYLILRLSRIGFCLY